MALKWSDDDLAKAVLHCSSRGEVKKNFRGEYDSMVDQGRVQEFLGHMPKRRGKYSKQQIERDALKYKSRYEWERHSKNFYSAARRSGCLDEVCSHMRQKNSWTESKVKLEADKYTYLSDWFNSSPKSYAAARRMNILKSCSRHMENIPSYRCFKSMMGSPGGLLSLAKIPRGYVYLARVSHNSHRSKFYKIGVSSNVDNRISTLTDNGLTVDDIDIIKTTNLAYAHVLEQVNISKNKIKSNYSSLKRLGINFDGSSECFRVKPDLTKKLHVGDISEHIDSRYHGVIYNVLNF